MVGPASDPTPVVPAKVLVHTRSSQDAIFGAYTVRSHVRSASVNATNAHTYEGSDTSSVTCESTMYCGRKESQGEIGMLRDTNGSLNSQYHIRCMLHTKD